MSDALIADSGSMPQQIAARTRRRAATFLPGQVTAVDSIGRVTVNLGGQDRSVTRLVAGPVQVGDNVLVMRQGNDTIVVGATTPAGQPTTGTVALLPDDSYTIRVTTSIGAVDAYYPASYTPTVGDTVLLAWLGTQPIAVGARGKTGAPTPPPTRPRPPTPTPPPAKPTTGTTTFTATGSGTWRGGGWRNDNAGNVIQGSAPGLSGVNNGAWFYGGKIRSTLAGATARSAQVWLSRAQGGNYGQQTVTIYRVTQNRRPAGNVTYDTSLTLYVALDVGEHGWYDLPATMAQALIDSGGSLGVHANSPYARLAGVSNTSRAGAIRIAWSR